MHNIECSMCGEEIKHNEEYEIFGLDGDFIHKKCRAKANEEMDTIANMNDEEFYKWMMPTT